jgi:hypothetical protein
MSEPTVEIVTVVVRVGTSALTMSPAEAVALRDVLLKQFPVEKMTKAEVPKEVGQEAMAAIRKLAEDTKPPWYPHFKPCPNCGMTHDVHYGCLTKTYLGPETPHPHMVTQSPDDVVTNVGEAAMRRRFHADDHQR